MAKKHPKQVPHARPKEHSRLQVIAATLDRHSVTVFVMLVALASFRIVSTYPVFNHTIDEPAHIACGMELLQKGVYRYEPQHPPLARVAAALGPYLAGRRIIDEALGPNGQMIVPSLYQEGAILLYMDNRYDRNLAVARLGILPFFWIASLVVYSWGRKYFSGLAALLAVFLFTFLPPVLAHAGLATTDMAVTAFIGASFFTGLLWAEDPNVRRTLLFGACTGLAVLSKFTSLLFLPAAFAAALLWHFGVSRRRDLARIGELARVRAIPFALAVLTGACVIWAGYRFSFGPTVLGNLRLPAPELFAGVRDVLNHNANGHPAYLLGMHSSTGWRYYYPVILAVKTPLAFLALLVIGVAACSRRIREGNAGICMPLIFSLGILIPSIFSHINIGVRHILPVYIGFSLAAGVGALELFEKARGRVWAGYSLVALLIWVGATSLFSHPDYIPYTNALAGNEPEKILVDSDLDWGQDMKRLSRRLRELGAREVTFNPFIVGYLEAAHGFPPIRPMDPVEPSPGWNAASLTVMKADRLGLGETHPEIQIWPERIPPMERVGKTTYLWYFQPQPNTAQPPR